MIEVWESTTPLRMASRLATYITDPSTIRVRVLENFGRAPSVEQCANLIKEKRPKPSKMSYYKHRDYTFRCGHPETEENTVIDFNGNDQCKTCLEKRAAAEVHRKELREKRRRARAAAAREKIDHKKLAAALDAIVTTTPGRPRIYTLLIQKVAEFFKIEPSDIVGPLRFQPFVDARLAVILVLRERGLSYPQIGRIMNRDHSSICHLVQIREKICARNPLVLECVAAVR